LVRDQILFLHLYIRNGKVEKMPAHSAQHSVWHPSSAPPRQERRNKDAAGNGQSNKRITRFLLYLKELTTIDGPLYLDLVSEDLHISLGEIVKLVEESRKRGRSVSVEKDQTGRKFILID
jgi:hypothetical protein